MKRKEYARAARDAALALPEAELRERVDRLLEQVGREAAYLVPGSPRSGMLHASEVLWLLGLGPRPGLPDLKYLHALIGEETDR